MSIDIKAKSDIEGEFFRTYIAGLGNGVNHEILCPKCLCNRWINTDMPTCVKCQRVDLIDHASCIEGKCTNS